MSDGKKCFICGSSAQEINSNMNGYVIHCLVCGEYVITHEASHFQRWNNQHERACVSAFIRERMIRKAEPPILFLNEADARK